MNQDLLAIGPEDPTLKERLTSLLDDVPCLSARSPRDSNGHGGDEHRPWVVPVLLRRREPNLLKPEATHLDGRATSRGLQGRWLSKKPEDLHGFTMIYHPIHGHFNHQLKGIIMINQRIQRI